MSTLTPHFKRSIPTPKAQAVVWRTIQKQNFKSIPELAAFLELKPEDSKRLLSESPFPLNLPLRLAKKIQKGTLKDPILKQFLPLDEENQRSPDFSSDPLLEEQFKITSKLIHKYPGRVLLMPSSACALHCRYCFRREFPYEQQITDFEEEFNYIENQPSIHELILSGGDPLSVSDEKLENLLEQFSKIRHLKTFRFHTRFLIGIPERITDKLCHFLKRLPQQIVIVIHSNHPLELDREVHNSLQKLKTRAGALLLNQSVLLEGVNDNFETLKALSMRLIECSVIPYYLHQLDRVSGTTHFEVSSEKGLSLIKELRENLSGYGIPNYVQEVPLKKSKTIL